jgi:hypothetical protein
LGARTGQRSRRGSRCGKSRLSAVTRRSRSILCIRKHWYMAHIVATHLEFYHLCMAEGTVTTGACFDYFWFVPEHTTTMHLDSPQSCPISYLTNYTFCLFHILYEESENIRSSRVDQLCFVAKLNMINCSSGFEGKAKTAVLGPFLDHITW